MKTFNLLRNYHRAAIGWQLDQTSPQRTKVANMLENLCYKRLRSLPTSAAKTKMSSIISKIDFLVNRTS